MGLAIYAGVWFKERRVLGVVLMGASCVAFVDGWVVKAQTGGGEWNHWGYAPMVGLVGLVMMGFFDGKTKEN